MNREYIILSALWIAYCAVHSMLISITVTGFMKDKLKERYRFYRLFYNLFSIAAIIPVVIYTWSINGEYFFVWSGWLTAIRAAMYITAAVIFFSAAGEYDLLQTMGIRQIMSGKTHRVLSSGASIKDTGILGMVRHPFYTAVFLIIWGGNQSETFLIVNIILSAYLVIGTMLEERKLIIEFGDEYVEYKKRVSMFLPVKWVIKLIVPSPGRG